jgi:hypothetical protein
MYQLSFFQLMSQQESSDLLIKTLQIQLTDLQKSETVLKAKQHYEQVVKIKVIFTKEDLILTNPSQGRQLIERSP